MVEEVGVGNAVDGSVDGEEEEEDVRYVAEAVERTELRVYFLETEDVCSMFDGRLTLKLLSGPSSRTSVFQPAL